jgi:hypothetical protein
VPATFAPARQLLNNMEEIRPTLRLIVSFHPY